MPPRRAKIAHLGIILRAPENNELAHLTQQCVGIPITIVHFSALVFSLISQNYV
jgi:hypothetical protein